MVSLKLLAEAQGAGLKVTAEEDRLIIRGPKRAEPLTMALLAKKQDILALMSCADREPAVEAGLQVVSKGRGRIS
jgi:hypothetical protein